MRFLIRFLIFLVVIAALAYTAVWFYAANEVKSRLKSEFQQRLGPDTSLFLEEVAVSGFPLGFNVHLKDLSVEARADGFFWQAPESLSANYSLFAPLTLSANLSGQHLISGIEKNADWPPMTLNLDARSVAATVGLDQKIKEIDVNIPTASLNIDGLGDTILSNLNFSFKTQSSNDVIFTGQLEAITPPEPISDLVSLKGASIKGLVVGGFPKTPKKRHLQPWQQAGGRLNIESFAAILPPVSVDGSGTISLSDRLQPNVDIIAYAQNFDEMLTKLNDFGLIPEDKLSLVQLGSVMFKRPARSGQGNEMVLPLKVTDGSLSFGPLKLLTLPTINWSN